MAGYGVFLTRRQLDECVDGARKSATRLMQNLLSVFFTPDQFARSSAMGTRLHPWLDQDILSACMSIPVHIECGNLNNCTIFLIAEFVQNTFAVSRAVLIDATNDKCSQYRRKNK